MMKCNICGCTARDCRQCIEKTGFPCHWVGPNLCSACADPSTNISISKRRPYKKFKGPKEDPNKKLPFIILKNNCITNQLPEPVPEYKFHTSRGWKFDFAWPERLVALEVEGGIFGYRRKDGTRAKGGAHSSITGILRDIEKYNAATMMGWRVIRIQPKQLHDNSTFQMIQALLKKS